MELTEHQLIHKKIMQAICEVIQEEDKPLVLKGGTALFLGYNLQRFSEDLDFDLTIPLKGHLNMESICKNALKKLAGQGFKVTLDDFKELKKTETTHRCRPMFSAGEDLPPIPLKIEISSRSTPAPESLRQINGIKVYSISEIARLKLLAAVEDDSRPYRTAARDLHDLAFIADQWEAELPADIVDQIETFFSDVEHLMERYADAYEEDTIICDRLYDDLSIIERWLSDRGQDDTLTMLGP